jgi:tetratricopeptide (TPR) repeat protein
MTSLFRSISVLALLVPALGSFQDAGGQIPEKFENLQVLPKDIARPQLVQVMRGFTTALGVRCAFCHVHTGQESDLSTFDFKSDDKPAKRTARLMMNMVHVVNDSLLAPLDTINGRHHAGADEAAGHDAEHHIAVQCATCHRGASRPSPLESIVTGMIADSGVPAAVANYRELKRRFYGGYTYDFRERPLNTVAGDLIRANRLADAVTILTLNLETNPDSWMTHTLLGDAFAGLGQKDSAIASYRKSLELQPENPPVKAKLDALLR